MSTDTPRPERVTLCDEEREQFENRLRWHFNVVAEEGKGSIYASLGIDNAVLDVERILAAREQALREERDAAREALARVEALVSGEGRPGVAYGAVPFKPRGMDSLVLHLAHVRAALRGETR